MEKAKAKCDADSVFLQTYVVPFFSVFHFHLSVGGRGEGGRSYAVAT